MHEEQDRRADDVNIDEQTENTPLVGHGSGRSNHHRHGLSVASVASIAARVVVPKAHSTETTINILCVLIAVTALSGGFAGIPFMRLVEDAICHQHYGRPVGEPIDEKLCKNESIQGDLAFLLAILVTLQSIVEVTAAFPWSIATDRLGRKCVVSLALTGLNLGLLWNMVVLYFQNVMSINFIWLSPATLLVGGGNAALIGAIGGIICDVAPEEKRSISFMRINVASSVGNLVSPALASIMMKACGPWPTFWVSVACLTFGAVSFLLIPETLHQKHSVDDRSSTDEPAGFKAQLIHTFERFKESLSILKSPSLMLLLIVTLSSSPIMASLLQFLIQFISKRYDIAIQSTGYVQSAYGIGQVVSALVLVPAVARFLMKDSTPKAIRMANEGQRDLWLARWSYGFIVLGCLFLASAPTLTVFVLGLLILALGSGYNGFVRSLMSMYVDPEHQSRLFTLVGMIEIIGNIYASPMLAALFTLGMRLGGGWIGLPYYGVAGLCAAVVAMLLLVRAPKHSADPPRAYDEATREDDC